MVIVIVRNGRLRDGVTCAVFRGACDWQTDSVNGSVVCRRLVNDVGFAIWICGKSYRRRADDKFPLFDSGYVAILRAVVGVRNFLIQSSVRAWQNRGDVRRADVLRAGTTGSAQISEIVCGGGGLQ